MNPTVRIAAGWPSVSCALLALLFLSGAGQPALGQESQETTQQTNAKIKHLAAFDRGQPVETAIGMGDVLHIDVFDIPELSRDIRVSNLGYITFPLIPGKIAAADVSPSQLEARIEQLLLENGLVTNPQVSVFVKEQNSQPVSIVGAVKTPKVYQVVRPTTLLEVLADAGGIADNAGNYILVTRPTPPTDSKSEGADAQQPMGPQSQTFKIGLQQLLESGDISFNIPVRGGDVVSVPEAGVIYVAGGGVNQPGGYVLLSHGEQPTVLKSVAMAHGLGSFSKPDNAVILRYNPVTGQRDEIPVRIKEIQNRKAEDIPMRPNDILFVPDSLGKKVLARGAEAAIGITSGILVYRSGNF
jgi:polysaccharide export outer membrane protein